MTMPRQNWNPQNAQWSEIELDPTHPLYNRILHAWWLDGSKKAYDLKAGITATSTSGVKPVVNAQGVAAAMPATSDAYTIANGTLGLGAWSELSCFAVLRTSSTTSGWVGFFENDGTDNYLAFTVSDAGDGKFGINSTSAANPFSIAAAINTNYAVGMSAKSAGTQFLAALNLDSQTYAEASAAAATYATDPLGQVTSIGGDVNDTGFAGHLKFFVLFKAPQLTQAELRMLTLGDNYQLFRPKKKTQRVGVAGGTAHFLTVTASMSMTPSMVRGVAALKSATLTMSAALQRAVSVTKSASVSMMASVVRGVSKAFSASMSMVATAATQKVKLLSVTASLSLSASTAKQLPKVFSASVTSSATMVRAIAKSVSASLSMVASTVRAVAKSFSKTISMTAATASQKVKLVAVSASMALNASLVRQVAKSFTATMTASASLARAVSKTFAAQVTLSASAVRGLFKTVSKTLTMAASTATQKVKLVTVSASIAMQATARRALSIGISASISMVASTTRRIAKTVTSGLSMAASAGKGYFRTLAASISMSASSVALKILAGARLFVDPKYLLTAAARIRTIVAAARKRIVKP